MYKRIARYAAAIAVVSAAFLLRRATLSWLGLSLPPYFTSYLAVMVVAVFFGLGPGLLATALVALGLDYFDLSPTGRFAIAGGSDRTALAFFVAMSVLISVVPELWKRQRRVLAADAVAESLAMLKAALASITDAVFISDAKGNFIHLNEAFAAFHRFRDKAECLRRLDEYPSLLDVFTPDGKLVPLKDWAVPRALRGETVLNTEFRLRHKLTGESWTGSYSFGPIHDPAGSIVGSVVVARDVTEQKEQELELDAYRRHLEKMVDEETEKLGASEKRYRELFESLPVGIVVQAADGRIMDANESACRILRLTMDQLCGRTSMDPNWKPVHADGSPFPGEEHPAMCTLATGEAQHGIIMGLGDADDRAWISINSHPLHKAGEAKPYAAITSFQDITHRVEDEEIIAALNRQYHDVLSAATEVAIIATDLNGLITLFNTGAERMLGYSSAEVAESKTVAIFHDPAELEATANKLREELGIRDSGVLAVMAAARVKGSFQSEWTYLRKDGSRVQISASVTPVRSRKEETTGYLAVVQDITEKLRLEETLRVSARTDHLTGLANRKVFEEAIDIEFKRIRRFRSVSSLMLVDIDHFKAINDRLGHGAGDRALVELAKVLKRTARSTDLPARFGGDEFMVLLVGSDLKGAMVIAEHVRLAIEAIAVRIGSEALTLTASIGVSMLAEEDTFWTEAMDRADGALYRAKSKGRNAAIGLAPDGAELDGRSVPGKRSEATGKERVVAEREGS